MKRFRLIIISVLLCLTANAQTLQQGRNYFAQGNYVKAKPIILKYLKQKPEDASRNYWYGVCCMETGERDKAVPYLKKAADKKIFKANRVLGEYYLAKEDYQNAINYYEAFVKGISTDKELHDPVLEERITTMTDSIRQVFRMIRNTTRVCFIDSFKVAKNELFESYILSESTGSVSPVSDFFRNIKEGEAYLPEMGQTIYYSRPDSDGRFHLYTQLRSFDRWTDETAISGLETDGDLRYPFLLNDGVTIYYAASGSESMGGLDIFVSRYNTATGKYLKPENLGMPFNSEANDYLYVIDEANNLGWFATDRRQNDDTVCVYVFIPTEGHQKYKYEGGDTLAIHRAARLQSIAETQTDLNEVRAARQRLTLLRYELAEKADEGSFSFIIDDFTTYNELSDFESKDAANLYERWTQLKHEYQSDALRLERMRNDYHNASLVEKERMTGRILDLEEKVLKTEKQVLKMENDVRTTEINYLNR
jgi:tetratricopeptide (TPR) repeat protein